MAAQAGRGQTPDIKRPGFIKIFQYPKKAFGDINRKYYRVRFVAGPDDGIRPT